MKTEKKATRDICERLRSREWQYVDPRAPYLDEAADTIEALRNRLAGLPDVQRTTSPESGAIDCWLHFKSSEGKHAQISLAAIAEKAGPIVRAAIFGWIVDRHAQDNTENKKNPTSTLDGEGK